MFPDDFLKNPYKRCRKNPYRRKKFCTFFFDMGIKLKDFASTIEIRHTFLSLTIPNYFININHIFKCNNMDTLYSHCDIIRKLHSFNLCRIKNQNKIYDFEANKIRHIN